MCGWSGRLPGAAASPKAARPRHSIDSRRRYAGQCQLAHHQLAHRHQRKAQGSFCCCSRAGRGRTTAADRRQGVSNICRGMRCLADSANTGCRERRNTIFANLPAKTGLFVLAATIKARLGAMGLRAGAPTVEGGARPRSLRGPIPARPSPSCADDDDRLRLPLRIAALAAARRKKRINGRHRHDRLYPPCAHASFSNSSLDHRRGDVRIVENGLHNQPRE